jgi:hypothetical protein
MWLPAELARKLRTVAAWRGEELGRVAGPAIDRELSRFYVAERTGGAGRPDPAAGLAVVPGPEPDGKQDDGRPTDGPPPAASDEAAA